MLISNDKIFLKWEPSHFLFFLNGAIQVRAMERVAITEKLWGLQGSLIESVLSNYCDWRVCCGVENHGWIVR